MNDILTVMTKELKEAFLTKSIWRTYGIALLLALFFSYLNRDNGIIALLLFSALISFAIAGTMSRDTFLGERERKTLEPLLATRLPGYSIYFGKVAAIFISSYLVVILSMLLGIVVFKTVFSALLVLSTPIVFLAFLGAAPFILYVASASSMRIKDQKAGSLVLLAFMMVPAIAGKHLISRWWLHLDFSSILLMIIGLTIAAGIIIMAVGLAFFDREKLLY
ncbi:MAG: hypothetical protein C4575_10335 [Desulforudis sp.]|jgi:ABC-type Na+ efflux pump permease subunit|nr:MAG: hypothetical protein C4575_10335 [Desulforudis sp.]